jgi:hypothetical protein
MVGNTVSLFSSLREIDWRVSGYRDRTQRSNAGGCRYKGDWRLVWWAWHYAKDGEYIPDDDPIPYTALLNLAVPSDDRHAAPVERCLKII